MGSSELLDCLSRGRKGLYGWAWCMRESVSAGVSADCQHAIRVVCGSRVSPSIRSPVKTSM